MAKRMVKAHALEKTHRGHSMHMCELASKKRMDKMADLAKGAKYLCHFCGRAAAKAENLCEPVEM